MINLIPPDTRKRSHIEYLLRVGATFAILFGVTALLIGVAYVPTYVLIDAQIQSLREAGEENEDRDMMIAEAESAALKSKNFVTQLRNLPQGLLSSQVISEIQNENPGNVTLKRFTVQAETNRITHVVVQGIAPTRSDLAQYKVSLENNALFETAEVPIADLARDSDLPFVITVTLAEDV